MKERKEGNKHGKKKKETILIEKFEKRNLFPDEIKLKGQFILLYSISI